MERDGELKWREGLRGNGVREQKSEGEKSARDNGGGGVRKE